MLGIDEAHGILVDKLTYDPGKFYGSANGLNLGVGQIFAGIRFPIYSEEKGIFQTANGIVYVVTHECDIDQNNKRPFNTHLLICPILDFRIFVEEYQKTFSESVLKSLISRIALRDVSRVIYLPYYNENDMPYGGLLYLNQITNTSIDVFSGRGVQQVCTVTSYGLGIIDQSICNHLLRPKVEALPLMNY